MRRTATLAVLSALLFLIGGPSACDKGGGDDEACAPLRAALNEALSDADAAVEAFRPAIQAAAENPPATTEAACTATDLRERGGLPVLTTEELATYEPGVVRTIRQSHASSIERMIEDCDIYLPEDRQLALDDLAADVERLHTGYELVLVELLRVDPVLVESGQFRPGQVRVRGLVWSYADQAVVCTAEAMATNREEVQTTNQRRTLTYLNDDLNDRAAIEVARSLRAVAP